MKPTTSHTDEKGISVNSTEQSTKTPSSWTGLFAALLALLSLEGRGARLRNSLALVTLVSALSAAPAAASPPITFAESGEGAGQVRSPFGTAVDQSSGVVYVADAGNHRIDEFDSSGHFIMAFGWGVLDGAEKLETCTFACEVGGSGTGAGEVAEPDYIAVDQASHDIYVSTAEGRRVQKFSPSGEFIFAIGKEVDKTKVAEAGSTAAEQDLCTAASGDTCGGGGQGAGPGEFDDANGDALPVAVDSSGNVWVGDRSRIEEFSSSGVYESQVSVPSLPELHSLAIDSSGDFYATSFEANGVYKLTPSGEPIYTVDESGGPAALALDGSGHLFVGGNVGQENYYVLELAAASGVEMERFGAGEIANTGAGGALAFGDAAKALYIVSRTAQIFTLPPAGPLLTKGSLSTNPVNSATATIEGALDSEGAETAYHFEYLTEAAYEKNLAEGHPGFEGAVKTSEAMLPADFAEHPVSASLTGLKGETTYRFRLIAANANGEGNVTGSEEATFTTLAPLVIGEEFVSDVTSTSAALSAEIDTRGNAGEYRFEYITEAAYRHAVELGEEPFAGCGTPASPSCLATPEGLLAPVEAVVGVSQSVHGLTPDVAYRYRVVGVDSAALARLAGPVQVFTTQRAGVVGESTLLDGREWELVSPPDKHGAAIEQIASEDNFDIQASAAGGAVTYETAAPTEAQPAGSPDFSQVLSRRTPSGWVSKDITIPNIQPTGVTIFTYQDYRVFSADLSLSVVQPFGPLNRSLSAEASEQTAYLHSSFSGGDGGGFCASGCFRPLVTAANVPEGTKFGESGFRCPIVCGPAFVVATPDLSHVVLNAPPLGLVEWSAGQLTSIPLARYGNGVGEAAPIGFRHGISSDGSRITNGGEMFDAATGQTLKLDAPEPQCVKHGECPGGGTPKCFEHQECTMGGGVFQIASSDDSKVFFTDELKLTSDAKEGGRDLYECEVVEEEEELHCKLSDLTPESSVQGDVLGASEDGSYIYFVAGGGQLDVYHDGTTKVIAELSGNDSPDWGGSANSTDFTLTGMTARVSPDGRWLAFMSQADLTEYDNRDAVSGDPDEEVYLYHAAAGGGEGGTLACASCDPTGARPHGVEPGSEDQTLAGIEQIWPGRGVAANVPGWSVGHEVAVNSPYQSRYLSNGGRLFFNSSDALVPQDTNGTEDVYEYEPADGPEAPVGDTCTTESSTYNPHSEGCVGLISSGASPEESAFLDASESGGDVFFLTAAELAAQDHDTAIDVYDAHACSAESPCSPPPPAPPVECQGDACQSPVQAPNDATPGSLTFRGPGNAKPASTPVEKKTTKKTVKCRKGFTKKKSRCVKVKRKSHKAKKANKRRAR